MVFLSCNKLNRKKFLAFGDVIELPQKPDDAKKSQRWSNISVPDFKKGKPVIDVLYSALRPLEVDQLEMHSNCSQTFLPLNTQQFIIVVGANPDKLKAFISDGLQGITLKAGIWHCSPLPIKKSIIFALLHRSPNVDLNSQISELAQIIHLKI